MVVVISNAAERRKVGMKRDHKGDSGVGVLVPRLLLKYIRPGKRSDLVDSLLYFLGAVSPVCEVPLQVTCML